MAESASDIGAANNLPLAIEFAGELDTVRLGRALREVVEASPALRTDFLADEGFLRRVERAPADIEVRLPVVGVDENAVAGFVEEHSRVPLDLLGAPWMAWLLRTSRRHHVLLAIFHHAIFDGPSKDIFVHELLSRYTVQNASDKAGSRSPASYAEYVSRERASIDELQHEARRFWEPKLPLIRAALSWPRSPHADRRDHGTCGAVRFELGADRRDRLASVAAASDTSLFTALVAVVQLLQYVYAGRSAAGLVTAIPLGTRRSHERRDIGMFVNEVPLYSELRPDVPFSAFLADTSRRAKELMALRDFPYMAAVSNFGRGFDPRTLTPSVSLSYWRTSSSTVEGPVPARVDRRLPVYGRRVPLSFRFVEDAEDVASGLEYDSSVLPDHAAHRTVNHLITLIDRVAAQPRTTLREISPLDSNERVRLTGTWNATSAVEPDDTVVDEIARAALRHPSRVAVEAKGETLTYSQLERRAETLARRLADLGIGRDRLVGIYLERSVNLLVGVLGTLKTGAAYVPLDPRYPSERLAFMLADSCASVVLTERSLASQWAGAASPLVLIDDSSEGSSRMPLPPRPQERAYVIYTSGSTGKPKGVELTHAGLSNIVRSLCREPGLRADDVFLSMTTLSFDIGSVELLAPLTVSGKVTIAPALTSTDGTTMRSLLSTTGATITFATPSSWQLAIRAGWEGHQRVLVGGEPLPPLLAAELVSRSEAVWNIYGPTETTVFSTCGRIVDGNDITIGRPVANTKLYVVDREGQLTPIGVPGELWIAGAGVARGYLNRRELTENRFISNPFASDGSRVFKTGDVVGYRDDGDLEFLGRLDDQVKIRGNRVEPGEIEALLVAQPEVREAAVVARDAREGDKRLVAYFVGEQPVSPRALRGALSKHLPAPMVPSSYVPLDRLPLLPNGKLDRNQLPDPPVDVDRDHHMAPADRIEEALAAVWASVLGLPRVSVCDNFFELGGHSLLAADVIARSRDALKMNVPIGLIFAAPTVREMAQALRSGKAAPQATDDTRTATRIPLSELA